MKSLKDCVISLIAQLGYQVSVPIVVFESDDWGSIRVPSYKALKYYQNRYPEHDLDHYQCYDGIDSPDDILALAETLAKHEVDSGKPCFVLNFATANPCFGAKQTIFDHPHEFAYETIAETYSRTFAGPSTIDTLKNDDSACTLFHMQLHAREHLNATQWMRGIQQHEHLRYAFELGMVGVDPGPYCSMDALNKNNNAIDHIDYLCEAAAIFENLFGYSSTSFIAPCYVIGDDEYAVLAELGVATLQGARCRNKSRPNGKLTRYPNIFGRRNAFGQVQLIRNCQFEPSKYYHLGVNEESCVSDAISDLEQAFSFRQPAIFCTHRVNYTSFIDVENRAYSLRCLERLLAYIVHTHPDVIFTTSDRLGKLIAQSYDHDNKAGLALLAGRTLS